MTRIFISYRRSDTLDQVGRLYDSLKMNLSGAEIFRDLDSIYAGDDFRVSIQDWLKNCDLVLVVIGTDWLAQTTDGSTRIWDSEDPVRREISASLERGLPIIPIYVGGASPPNAEQLPRDIQNLAFLNGLNLRSDPDYQSDFEKIEAVIRQRHRFRTRNGRPLLIGTASALFLGTCTWAIYSNLTALNNNLPASIYVVEGNKTERISGTQSESRRAIGQCGVSVTFFEIPNHKGWCTTDIVEGVCKVRSHWRGPNDGFNKMPSENRDAPFFSTETSQLDAGGQIIRCSITPFSAD